MALQFTLLAMAPNCSPANWTTNILQGYAAVMDVADMVENAFAVGMLSWRFGTEGVIDADSVQTLVINGIMEVAQALRSGCFVAGTPVVVGREKLLVWDQVGDEPGEPGFGVVFGATIVVAGAVALAADEIGSLRRGASRKKKRADEEELDDLFGGEPIDWREAGEETTGDRKEEPVAAK